MVGRPVERGEVRDICSGASLTLLAALARAALVSSSASACAATSASSYRCSTPDPALPCGTFAGQVRQLLEGFDETQVDVLRRPLLGQLVFLREAEFASGNLPLFIIHNDSNSLGLADA